MQIRVTIKMNVSTQIFIRQNIDVVVRTLDVPLRLKRLPEATKRKYLSVLFLSVRQKTVKLAVIVDGDTLNLSSQNLHGKLRNACVCELLSSRS